MSIFRINFQDTPDPGDANNIVYYIGKIEKQSFLICFKSQVENTEKEEAFYFANCNLLLDWIIVYYCVTTETAGKGKVDNISSVLFAKEII